MTNLLYRWPAAAKFGKRVPKDKFYEHGSVPASVRERFVSDVQRLIWAYKLAEVTINLPGSEAVPEIQVFRVDAKEHDVSNAVLTAIDKAIPSPIIFEITRDDGRDRSVRMVAAQKQVGSGAQRLSAYYSTTWQQADVERRPLPTAINLAALYAALLDPLLPVTARAGEDGSEVAARVQAVRALEREIASLERKLRTEPQLNRKIDLRRTLQNKQSELEQQR